MKPRTLKRKEIWPLKSSSEFLGVLEDSIFPLSGVWVAFSHLPPKWGCDKVDVIIYTSQNPLVPKSLELPLYHRYSLLKVNHITRPHRNPQKLTKMMATTTSAHEIIDSFIISYDLVPKMQTLDLLFPSWRSWHNEKSSSRFKRRSLDGLPSPTDYYQNPNKIFTS